MGRAGTLGVVAGARSSIRRWFDTGVDAALFRIDNFPRPDYHPADDAGDDAGDGARRSAGARSRWARIAPLLEPAPPVVATALDIGCNGGYFTVNLARRGVAVVGVEREPKFRRTVTTALRRAGLSDAGVLDMDVTPTTVDLLPSVDMVLFLSVWHHMVKAWGIDVADDLLRSIWGTTRAVMFFDSGEAEMPASWGLPDLGPDAAVWYADHLERTCESSRVVALGRHQAFGPEGEPCHRTLFAVVRPTASAVLARLTPDG